MGRWALSLQVRNHNRFSVCHFASFSTHTQNPSYSESDLEKATAIVLENKGKSLFSGLEQSGIRWSPPLVEKVLKNIWNDGTQALQFFNWVGKQNSFKHSPDAYNYMIDILGRMKDYRTLWHLMANMQREGCPVTPKTFAIIIERYIAAGREDKATRVFFSMPEYGCPPDLPAFNAFLDSLCKAKKVLRADRIFRDLKYRFRPDSITYNTLANGWCMVKNIPMAQRVLKEMVDKGFEPTPVTYNTLLHGFFITGQVKEAWLFYKEIKCRGFSPNVVTYTTIIYGIGMAGKVEKAKKIFDNMIENDCLPNVATYNAMIQVLCRKKSVTDAFEVFDEMLRRGYFPNLTTYNILIRGLCHAKQMERALEFKNEMEKNGCHPDVRTFNIIIGYFCDLGQIERALSILKDMGAGPCLPNLDTYNILLSALCATRKSDGLLEAGKLLQEMVQKGFIPRRFVYNRVINGLFLTGSQEFAKELLRAQSQSGHLPKHIRM